MPSVVSIYIGREPAKALESVTTVRAVAGQGTEGDRYFVMSGSSSEDHRADQEITLIEIEAVEALRRDYKVEFEPAEARRNIITRGIALNHLIDHDFRVGGALLHGMRLCEP